jgi:hypothetical protein
VNELTVTMILAGVAGVAGYAHRGRVRHRLTQRRERGEVSPNVLTVVLILATLAATLVVALVEHRDALLERVVAMVIAFVGGGSVNAFLERRK